MAGRRETYPTGDPDGPQMYTGFCIDCDAVVDGEYEVSELVTCAECGTEMEYTGRDTGFVAAPQEQEDWGE